MSIRYFIGPVSIYRGDKHIDLRGRRLCHSVERGPSGSTFSTIEVFRGESVIRGGQLVGPKPGLMIVDLRGDHELVRPGLSDEAFETAAYCRRRAGHGKGQHLAGHVPVARRE